MARTKGAKNKPKLNVVGDGPGLGHNIKTAEQLSDDQLQALTRQHAVKRARLVDAEKKAKADRMNLDRLIKSELGENGLDDIKLLEKLESDEGEKQLKARRERELRVARWAGLSIGTQGQFELDRRPAEERAFDDGKRAGMKGEDCKPSHAPGTGAYDEWIRGWHEGQAVLATGFGKKAPDAPVLLREEGATTGGQDDFDQAADSTAAAGTNEPGEESADASDDPLATKPWPDDAAIGAQKQTGGI